MTLVRRNVTFNDPALGREGEAQLERHAETVELELGDDAVIATTEKALPEVQLLSDTQSQTGDSSDAKEEDVVVPRRTTRVNAGGASSTISDARLVAHTVWDILTKPLARDILNLLHTMLGLDTHPQNREGVLKRQCFSWPV